MGTVVTVISIILVIAFIILAYFAYAWDHDGVVIFSLILSAIIGIYAIVATSLLIYVSITPYRPGYCEMLKRVEASGGYDVLLNKEIYEWNALCDWYNYEQYKIEYKKGVE